MGILPSPKPHEKAVLSSAKRRSVPTDFAALKPLKPGGALGFSTFRDTNDRSTSHGGAKKASKADSDMDSDEDDVIGKGKSVKQEDVDSQETGISAMSPDDVKRQGELAEGVQKIRVCDYFIFGGLHPFCFFFFLVELGLTMMGCFFAVKTTTFSRSIERNVASHTSVPRLQYPHWRIYPSSPLEFDRIPRHPPSQQHIRPRSTESVR